MRRVLAVTQAPHASFRNGGSAATARQYFLRKTQRNNNGPRIAAATDGLGPGELRLIWGDVSGEVFSVRSPENNNGYNTLDWTPYAAWDDGTRQIISGGLRIMRKLKIYSDRTGDWREGAFPSVIGRLVTPGHWYSGTAGDGAGNVYLHLAAVHRYTPATDTWAALPAHVTTNGGSGSSLVWVPTLFGGVGGLVKYGGDARRWLIYNPATNTWPSYVDGLPCGAHSILAYHPAHDKVLMVGGTGTETVAALVTPSTGAASAVAAPPAMIAMDTSDWMVAHPDGCWLLRSGVAGRMYAYWPGTDTWEDKGAAPDAALTTPQAAFDAARSTVYITSGSGLHAYALPVYGPRSGTVSSTEGADTSVVVATSAGSIGVTITGTVPHAGAYSAAAAVAAPSAGIGVTVAATVTHAGAFSASAVVTVGISVTVGVTVVHAGSYSAVATVSNAVAPPEPTDAQVDFDLWYPFIIPTVAGCPDETMIHHVRQACIEFCERTGVWTENLAPITSFEGVAEYSMSPPAGSAIVKLLSFTMSGRTADFVNQTDGEQFRIEQAACNVAWTPNKVTLSVSPTPGAMVSTFGVRAALKPSQDATTIGASIFQQYAAQIAAGALWGIYAMVDKPWTNAGASTAMRALFDSHISKTALKASFGFARGRRRSAIRYF